AQHPDDIIVIIPVGWGSTTLVTTNGSGTTGAPQWIEPTGNLNIAAVNQVNAFMSAYPSAVIHSMHWIQGENDAGGGTPATETQYYDGLTAIVNGWRTRITGNSTAVPFVIGSMVPAYAGSGSGLDVSTAQRNVANDLTNVHYVDTIVGFDDGLHYIHQGASSLGLAMGRAACGLTTGSILNDSFASLADGADVSTLDWAYRSGSGVVAQNGRIFFQSTARAIDAPVQPAGINDYAVGAHLTFLPFSSQALSLRGRAIGYSSMTGYELRFSSGTKTWSLIRFDGSSASGSGAATLGSYVDSTLTSGNTRTAYLDMRGSTIRAVIDGVERIAATDATYNSSLGACGLIGNGSTTTTGIHVD
ncbi:MAG: hypothetical protein J0H99_23425, partial [Rhodospirillales bacterium]|nr:hypothetical protein [Rhodospirillales bacterium]